MSDPWWRQLARWSAVAALGAAAAGLLAGPATAAPTTDPSPRPTTTEQPRPAAVPSAAASTAPTAPAPAAPAPTSAKSAAVASTAATCGGQLPLGKVKNCASITGAAKHTWTVTSTVDQDTLFVRLRHVSGDGVGGQVHGPDGAHACFVGPYLNDCRLGAAGTYTITVELDYGTGQGAYSLSAESMRAPSTCATLSESFFSFASAGRSGTLPAGLAARCFTFTQPTGTVLHLADPGGAEDIQGTILDGQFQPICTVRYPTECTLGEPGPYRLFLEETYGAKAAYTLKMPRISRSVGCPALPLTTFGDPGSAVGNGTVPPNQGVGCQKLRVTTPGPLLVRIDQYANQHLYWQVYDDAGQVVCSEYESWRACTTSAVGPYTLLLRNSNWEPVAYRMAVARLNQGVGCADPTGLAWEQPSLTVHQTSAVQTNCQPFHGEAGERIMVYRTPDRFNDVFSWIIDDQGAVLCTEWSEEDGCLLPSTGTFRVVSYLVWWEPEDTDLTYRLQIRDLSDASGCPTVTPGAYNAAPAGALGGIRCRVLDLPEGTFRVKAVGEDNYRQYGTVYDETGHKVCTDMWCRVPAAGRYTLVLGGGAPDAVIDDGLRYHLAVLPWMPSDCRPVSDTGWQDAPVRGQLATPAQFDCLQLSSPSGAVITELLPGDATGAGSPDVTVIDSTGAFMCDSSFGLRQYHCELTGEAPFLAVLTSRDGVADGPYALAFARTDGPPACPELPAGATGATVTTGADRFGVCLSIPADARAATESITWKRTGGTGDARLSVFDSAGRRYCGPSGYAVERTISCTLPAGPVTVVLEADAVDATYQLTHRDASTPAS
ncbi:hypothetical protein COO58_24550 [Micromonospora sp. WMMA1996]|uniref:hypothetical protein n=1 Tax=Micromonospora sp. WMMA1996 TaxID=2039878 RepID=UPI000BF81D2C|nr:hypothetical protein [Micromonospora sp. WMMA1996]PGH41714.1 hypothetical protein COO58_24550 [Micromonospora sp. WMMA1996]